ncbi:FecCD family ABC transporter permease [Baia soyae]|uniref:Iron complex transport system permease protein n=1 Tax=Baia soyae TaxID=1544746 RepID=A0A4R2S1J7_9BACL|nr:iron ABC transporter permease [Baia soyae]TCP69910.1 iron complex transport system permease protein [Baia soyae]
MKTKRWLIIRRGKAERVSLLFEKRSVWMITIFSLLLIVTFLLAAGAGEVYVNPIEVGRVIFGMDANAFSKLVVESFRLPRMIVAVLVGTLLAISGSILQGVVRNPLASPDLLGITGGASVAVVMFLGMFSSPKTNALIVSIHWLPLIAICGALVAAFILYSLAWKNGLSPVRLVLMGIGVWALTKALTTLFMVKSVIYRASQANVWITGSVYGTNWDHVSVLVPVALLLILCIFLSVRQLNVQAFGEEIAVGLGGQVSKQRLWLLTLSTVTAGVAVAYGGGISFVGLMAPHIARRLVGSNYGALLPISALIGGFLVLLADTIGRTFFLPLEVPAGVFISILGAPYFIYLLIRERG